MCSLTVDCEIEWNDVVSFDVHPLCFVGVLREEMEEGRGGEEERRREEEERRRGGEEEGRGGERRKINDRVV